MTMGAGDRTQGLGSGAADAREADAMEAIRQLAADPVGSETEESEETGGGAADDVPEGFELREDTVDQLPEALQSKARMVLAREQALAQTTGTGQQTEEIEEEEPLPEFDYDVDVGEVEGAEKMNSFFKQMGEHFDQRMRAIEKRERAHAKAVAMTSASQDLMDFRADHPDWKKHEKAMLQHSIDAPSLLDSKAGLDKLYKLAKADELEKQVKEGRIDKQAARRAGASPRFESKSQRSRERLPGQADSLEEAMRMAAKQIDAESLL